MVEKSALYKDRYGAWAGLPRGQGPDYSRCCEQVWPNDRSGIAGAHQCHRARGHGPDGAYCKQHDPSAVAARDAAREAKYKKERSARRYEWYGREFFGVLVKIADGYNDARGLAKETIDAFKKGE